MGIEYAIACVECREFIDLHKWPINRDAASTLDMAFDLPADKPSGNFSTTKIPEISDHALIIISASQIETGISNYRSHPATDYIDELIPFVQIFTESHKYHTLFLCCDLIERPWEFPEQTWSEWKEVKAVFSYQGKFLPRNLVEDNNVTTLEEAVTFFGKGDMRSIPDDPDWGRAYKQALRKLLES